MVKYKEYLGKKPTIMLSLKSIKFLILSSIIILNLSGALYSWNLVKADAVGDASSEQFNVNELKAGEQKQSYFKDAENKQTSPVGAFLLIAIRYLILTIGSVSILMIIIGGIILVASDGKEPNIEKGKDTITYAIIGLIVAFSAYIISSFVQSLFY